MVQPAGLPSTWKDWGAGSWGDALFRHYFVGTDSRPVSRLAIGPEELARAVAASDSAAATAREAFLRAVRCSPSAFRRHLSSASLEAAVWNRRDPPPFLAYLFFTCFAAASLDADTADLGQFRERVRQLLGHAEGTTYGLHDLSKLWEAFAAWLQDRHDAGEPYRTLTLPDRGYMTLIGYSVRLAFPRREDRLRLREVLVAAGTMPMPTVPEALRAIDSTRNRFSADFRHVFDHARDAFVRGRVIPELDALWSAILESAALPVHRSGSAARTRYQLFAQEDELGRIDPFVVAADVPSRPFRGELRFSRLVEPFDAFDHVICDADGNPSAAAKSLLLNALHDRIPGLSGSPVIRAVRDGVLLFQRLDSATWELTATRPTEGKMRALVRDDLAASFLRLLIASRRHARETQFGAWREVVEFDITELAVPRGSDATRLASVRCMQAVEIGPHVHLVGAIRVDGGILGIRGALPEVHCADAETGAVFRVSEVSGRLHSTLITNLESDVERPHVFRWPALGDDLDGPVIVAGTRNGRIVASREVVFHSRGLTHDYVQPTDPARWFIESSTSDVASAVPGLNAYLTTGLHTAAPLPPIATASAEGITALTDFSVDDDERHDRLAEVLAAISVARKGISEAELFELFTGIVPEAKEFGVWGIIRGWVEAGYLDCVTRRHWRGRVYFARRPQLVLPPQDLHSVRVVLHGLAPYHLRTAAREAFSRAAAKPLAAISLSPFVPAPLSWHLESVAHAEGIAEELGDLTVTRPHQIDELMGDFDVVMSDQAPLPPGYELQRVWDWDAGGFRRSVGNRSQGVRIEYYSRIDGPDRFIVAEGDRRRTTLSRTWALLDGFRRSGRKGFFSLGSTVIVRPGIDGPNVPLPVARVMALRTGVVGGPADNVSLGRCYLYAAASAGELRRLLAWLNGAKADESAARRFAWLREAASAPIADRVPVPADLRRRLRSLSLPDAVAIAEHRVPRRLIAHVRRAVELAES